MLIIIDQYHSWQCVVIIMCLLFVQKNMTSQIWFDLIMNLSSYLNEFTFTQAKEVTIETSKKEKGMQSLTK